MLAFFVISTHLGGAEKSLLDLAKALKESGQTFKVVLPKDRGPLIDQLDQAAIDWVMLPFPPWFLMISRKRWDHFIVLIPFLFCYLPFYFFRLHRFLKSYHIETIHSTGLKFHMILGLYAFCFRQVKLVIHLRDVIHSKWIRGFFRLIAKSPNILWVANSKVTAQSVAPIPCQVIYNGLPKTNASNEQWPSRRDFKLPEQKFLVGVVGAVARWKGQREFLLMARKLLDLGHDFHFVIVGDEIYDTEGDQGEMAVLKKYVQDFQIEDRVTFLGFQKKPQAIYRLLDVFVHSSIEPEPFGRVIIEAMQEGCPVTASAQGGPLEIIDRDLNGRLHEPANIQSMVEQVLFYYDHPEETQKITENAHQKLQEFSLEIHLEKMRKCLGLS